MKKILIIGLLFFVLTEVVCIASCCINPNAQLLKVYDGDTITLLVDGEEICVRLECIDCYETSKINRAYKQAYLNKISIEEVVKRGKQSKKILKNLLQANPNISVKITGKDIYGRALGIIYANGINVNEYMVTKGGCMRYHYKKR